MTQTWDPVRYASIAAFVPALGSPLIDLLAPRAGERILDLGCGDGALTADIVARDCTVVGIDSSPAQIDAARARGLDARVMDAQALAFEREFDGAFTNAALHWMPRQDLALAGAWRALRPGSRFVGELGAEGNVGRIVDALVEELAALGIDPSPHNPWTFPAPTRFRELLTACGFDVLALEVFARPTRFERELADWLELMAQTFLDAAPPDARAALVRRVTGRLRPALFADGAWQLDYVRLRFVARRPA
jgi:trans-aconitate methyltransferase